MFIQVFCRVTVQVNVLNGFDGSPELLSSVLFSDVLLVASQSLRVLGKKLCL